MLFNMPKGQCAPLDPASDPRRPDAASLHERKLAAWALAAGVSVPLAYPAPDRHTRRGELADLDMSLAGPDPRALPGLWRRLMSRLRWGTAKTDNALSGQDRGAIGARPQMPYIGGKPVA